MDLFYIICKEIHDTDKTYVVMGNVRKLLEILAVTGNRKDYKNSSLVVVSPKECIELL